MPNAGEAIRFIVVGGAGFLTDAGILWLAVTHWGMGPIAGRAISFPPAFLLTWMLHRFWTFAGGQRKVLQQQGLIYLAIQIFSFFLNFAIYALALQFFPLQQWYIAVLFVAAIVSSVCTLILSRRFAFS